MTIDVRVDPLTGTRTVHSSLTGKPLPRIERALNVVTPCPFCALVDGEPGRGDSVTDTDGVTRQVLAANDAGIAIPNRWTVLAPTGDPADGHSEVHVSREHVTSLEDLSSVQSAELGALLWERRLALEATYESVSAIVNVGVNAGGSVAHLHGQVNASGQPGRVCGQPDEVGCTVCRDLQDAQESGLGVLSVAGLNLYVPQAPSAAGELRIAQDTCAMWEPATAGQSLALVRELLCGLSQSGLRWPYNLVMHAGVHPHVHVLPRIDFGLVYQFDFGLVPVGHPVEAYAEQLRTALRQSSSLAV